VKLTRSPAVAALEAKAARVDAGRVRATLMAIVPDAPAVGAVLAIVKGGSALDVRVVGLGNDMDALASLSAYDVSMNVEKASFDVAVPPMELAGTSGKVRIAKGVLDARSVAATFGASKLSNGEMILALVPSVALLSLSTTVDLDLAENAGRAHCGLYRSEHDCKMRHLAAGFCGVCQEAAAPGMIEMVFRRTPARLGLRNTGILSIGS